MKILFISHESSRTGAPLVLYYTMEWIAQNNPEIKFDFLDLKDGILNGEFAKLAANSFVLHKKSKSKFSSLFNKLSKFFLKDEKSSLHEKVILNRLKRNNYDIIYANTALSLEFATKIKKNIPNIKLILHLHELDGVIKIFTPHFPLQTHYVDRWICASNLVSQNLIENYQVNAENIDVVYDFSRIPKYDSLFQKEEEESFIVGASGLVSQRKGYDLFISVAKEANRQMPESNIIFKWVGKIPNEKTQIEIDSELLKSNLTGSVFFIGEKMAPFEVYEDFDIFLMTSREDPFPLVCTEVASISKPIICFNGATGTQELLIKGGGKIVPYLGIFDMAREVIEYYKDRDSVIKDGQLAKQIFSKFSPEYQVPVILNILKMVRDQ